MELNGKAYFVAYGMLGRKLFVLDDQWNLAHTLPQSSDGELEKLSITGCQAATDGRSIRIGSLQGMFRFDLGTGSFEKVSDSAVKSFAESGETTLADFGNQLKISNEPIDEFEGWRVNAMAPFKPKVFVLTGTDETGDWQLFAVDRSGRPIWKESIGPQFLDNEADPLVVSSGDGVNMAVAICADGEINLVDADGKLLRLQADSSLRGVGFDCKRNWLFTSHGRRVLAWEIPAAGPEIIPASTTINSDR
jgi:hypothetical protein